MHRKTLAARTALSVVRARVDDNAMVGCHASFKGRALAEGTALSNGKALADYNAMVGSIASSRCSPLAEGIALRWMGRSVANGVLHPWYQAIGWLRPPACCNAAFCDVAACDAFGAPKYCKSGIGV